MSISSLKFWTSVLNEETLMLKKQVGKKIKYWQRSSIMGSICYCVHTHLNSCDYKWVTEKDIGYKVIGFILCYFF